MNIDSIVPLIVQIPLVGVFIWFVLERDKRIETSAEKRDADWRAFLKEQREQNNEAVGRLAEEVKQIGKLTASTNALIMQHDTRKHD